MNGRERILVVGGLLALAISQAALGSELSVSNDWVKLAWEEKTGSYKIICQDRGWEFSGKLPSVGDPATQSGGTDAVGAYRQVNLAWGDGGSPMTGSIRVYQDKPLVLFSETCGSARETAPAPFPDFSGLPAQLHVFSYRHRHRIHRRVQRPPLRPPRPAPPAHGEPARRVGPAIGESAPDAPFSTRCALFRVL